MEEKNLRHGGDRRRAGGIYRGALLRAQRAERGGAGKAGPGG